MSEQCMIAYIYGCHHQSYMGPLTSCLNTFLNIDLRRVILVLALRRVILILFMNSNAQVQIAH